MATDVHAKNVEVDGGYFVWWKTQTDEPACQKIGKEIWEGRQPENMKLQDQILIRVYPLTKTQFKLLNLDDLAKKFPAGGLPNDQKAGRVDTEAATVPGSDTRPQQPNPPGSNHPG